MAERPARAHYIPEATLVEKGLKLADYRARIIVEAIQMAIAAPRSAKPQHMPVIGKTVLLLVASNVFMTFAWYAHLRNLSQRPWIVAALVSWGIALFEYLLQVPANRIGHTSLELGQLKVLQEVITLAVFVPFAWLYMNEPLRWNYVWAGLCLCGAVFFAFRR